VVAVELVLWVKPLLAQQVVMVAMELLQLSQARLWLAVAAVEVVGLQTQALVALAAVVQVVRIQMVFQELQTLAAVAEG